MTGQRPGDTPRAVLSVSCRQSRDLNATATRISNPSPLGLRKPNVACTATCVKSVYWSFCVSKRLSSDGVSALIRHAGLRNRRPVIGAAGDQHRHTQRVNIAQRHIGAAIDEGVAVERPTLVQTSCTDYDQRDATSG